MENVIKIKAKKKKKNPHLKFIIGMLAWPVFHLICWTLFVHAMTFSMSLYRYDDFNNPIWYGFGNYVGVFKDIAAGGNTLQALLNSLSFLPLNLCIILPLSVFFAYFLYKRIWMYKVFRVIYFFPSLISVIIMVMSFQYMFDMNFGLVTMILKSIGLGGIIPAQGFFETRLSAYGMLWIYSIWSGLGHQLVLIQGSMLRIPKSVIEFGRLDGVGIWREMFQIVIPIIFASLATMILFSITGIFNTFITPQLMFGHYSADRYTIALSVIENTKQGNDNSRAGTAAIGVTLTLISTPIMMGVRSFLNKITPDVEY